MRARRWRTAPPLPGPSAHLRRDDHRQQRLAQHALVRNHLGEAGHERVLRRMGRELRLHAAPQLARVLDAQPLGRRRLGARRLQAAAAAALELEAVGGGSVAGG